VDLVTPESIGEAVICGPDPARVADGVREHVEAGYDRVVLHQYGPDQEAFIHFFERDVRPLLP
jgi:coenzyme F420-dependent glucose-6-phosphate dehydrogenase